MDPRYIQISILSFLLIFGTVWLDFPYRPQLVACVLVGAIILQWSLVLLCRELHDPTRWRSALISGLSLCLLVRVSEPWWLGAAVVVAITSKFVLKVWGRHIFNPTNFAIVSLLVLGDGHVWVSSGQWGRTLWFGFILASAAGLMLTRCRRLDLAASFFGLYAAMQIGRAWWHGDPMAIPLHQLQSGSLAVFALFMITDPKASPESFIGRLLFAGAVVGVAGYVEFWRYQPNGVFYGLTAASIMYGVVIFLTGLWQRRINNQEQGVVRWVVQAE